MVTVVVTFCGQRRDGAAVGMGWNARLYINVTTVKMIAAGQDFIRVIL